MRRLLLMARKDFRDSVRDRQLHYTGGLFLLIAAAVGYFGGTNTSEGNQVVGFLFVGLVFLAPLVAIVLSYNDVVGKRSTGEMTVLLGLPFSRGDVVLGSFLGRYVLVAAISVASLLVTTVLSSVLGTAPELTAVAGAGLALLVLVLAFVAISIGVSANTANTTRAGGLAFGAFLLFVVQLWNGLPGLVNLVLGRVGAEPLPSNLVNVYHNLTPQAAVRNLLGPTFGVVEGGFAGSVVGAPLGELAGLVVLLFWVVVPVALGYYRFGEADL